MSRNDRNIVLASILALVSSLALLVGGCRLSPPSECGEGPCFPDVQQVLHLQGVGSADVRTLDPPNATDTVSVGIIEMIFPGLVALDQNLNPIPWAAQSLPTVSADGLTWTFTLRRGLKWSDGTPITAKTYAFSIDRAENPCNAFLAAYYLYAVKDAAAFNGETCDRATNTVKGAIQTLIGDSITTPDDTTLKVQLAQPAPYFLSAMTYPASYAVPEQLINQYGARWTEHLADGAGFGGDLFKVTRWDHAGHLVLQRNTSFWGQQPKLREVDYTFYKDASAAYNAYLAGQADVGFAPVAQLAQARAHSGFHQIPIQQIDYYAMNWRMKPFDDVRMRQAFAIALDKTALANTILQETVLATNHIVPDGMPGYNPALLGPDGTQNLSGDTQMANQLATAYATTTGCGTATDFSKCPKVMLTIPQGNVDAQNEADAVRGMWLKAMPGYPITINVFTGGLLESTSFKGMQFMQSSWIEDYPDPQDWLSTNLACDSFYNTASACDKTADQLMRQADANPDPATRLAQYQQAEQILVAEVAWLPLDQRTTWWETKPYAHNFTIAANGLIPKEAWQSMYLTSH